MAMDAEACRPKRSTKFIKLPKYCTNKVYLNFPG